MRVELRLFPRGYSEGAPVVAVNFDGPNLPDEQVLRSAIIGTATRGCPRAIWLDRIPWENEGAARLILRATAGEELAGLHLCGMRKVGDKPWPDLKVRWTVDVSEIATATDGKSIEQRCDALPFLPAFDEIFLEGLPRETISSGLLEHLGRGMHSRHGFLYVKNDFDIASLAVCQTNYVWTCRRLP